jgi:hypothetical protein
MDPNLVDNDDSQKIQPSPIKIDIKQDNKTDTVTTTVIKESDTTPAVIENTTDNLESSTSEISMKDYWFSVLTKVIESVTSVKIWMWAFPFFVSTALAYHIVPNCKTSAELINLFNAWCTFNLGLTGTVVVVREQFKVEKIKRINVVEDIKNIPN